MLLFVLVYSIGPMTIRSSCVNAMYYERGLRLGHTREALAAALVSLRKPNGYWCSLSKRGTFRRHIDTINSASGSVTIDTDTLNSASRGQD